MPLYEFFCDKCQKEVSLTLSISEREKGETKCPQCRQPPDAPARRHVFLEDVPQILTRAGEGSSPPRPRSLGQSGRLRMPDLAQELSLAELAL